MKRTRDTPEQIVIMLREAEAMLAAADVDVAGYTYIVRKYCKTDLSMNGSTDTPDPVLWTENPVDVNGDGLVHAADLAATSRRSDDGGVTRPRGRRRRPGSGRAGGR